MKGFAPLFLGLIGTFVFSWAGLAWVPNLQIGRLDPQSEDEGADIYPWPQSGMAERGRQIYVANGCMYCHTQQVRADYAASDIDRKWGGRRSAPRDYLFARPVLLGRMRMGPDLANVGHRTPSEEAAAPAASPATGGAPAASPVAAGSPPASSPAPQPNAAPPGGSPPAASPAAPANANATPAPSPPPSGASAGNPTLSNPAANAPSSTEATTAPNGEPLPYSAAWHHKHLYSPRSINLDSIMPAYGFLYEKRRVEGQPAADALKLTAADAPPPGYAIVPTYDAKCLVAYLMSLDQSHGLKEVKSAAPAPAAKGGK